MHITVVTYDVPMAEHNAMRDTFPCHIRCLQESGHRVSCCVLLPSASEEHEPSRARRLMTLDRLGVTVVTIPAKWPEGRFRRSLLQSATRLLRPTLIDYYPWVSLMPQVKSVMERLQPDAIVIFATYEGLAATHGLKIAPRFVILGDPEHLPAQYRRQLASSKGSGGLLLARLRQLAVRHHLKLMEQLLAGVDHGGAVAAHHAEWFRRHGVRHCIYLRNLVPDLGTSAWQVRRRAVPRSTHPRILLLGHKRGTATLAGLYLFARELLPIVERALGPEGFEAHIIGRYDPPADLAALLAHPSVRIRDFVEDIDREFLASDIFLVPTPIALGVRTRILFAWSYGCCVVAHRANAAGIPEMQHEENALLAADGPDLAAMVLRAVGDPALRHRLGQRGRRTYERWFAPATAGKRMIAELERLALARTRAALEVEVAAAPQYAAP